MDRGLFIKIILYVIFTALSIGRYVHGEPYSPEQILSRLLGPFKAIACTLLALSFAVGVLGFIFLVVNGILNWVLGGSFGRMSAIRSFVRAAESLAAIPIVFLIVQVLANIGIPEVEDVAPMLRQMLDEGFRILLSALGG
ncbi:MAG: hypothetical protein J7L38_02330 [Thermoproteales archaeon]|nr:hypothetical protein [Thermoproteales archaeon]